MCLVCKTQKAEETHHIKEQENADENNMIEHINKTIDCICRKTFRIS